MPATTEVISPVPPPPTAEPLKYKVPLELYSLLVVVDGVLEGNSKASVLTSPANVAFLDSLNSIPKEPSTLILTFPVEPPAPVSPNKVVPPRASKPSETFVVLLEPACILKEPPPESLLKIASATIVSLESPVTLPIIKSGCKPIASKLPLTTKSPSIAAPSFNVNKPIPPVSE